MLCLGSSRDFWEHICLFCVSIIKLGFTRLFYQLLSNCWCKIDNSSVCTWILVNKFYVFTYSDNQKTTEQEDDMKAVL